MKKKVAGKASKANIVTFNKLPGVFSLMRRISMTDVLFFNEINGDSDRYPVQVVRHGISGTQNVNSGADKEVGNIQIVDSAKLDPRADAMVAKFSIRFLPLQQSIRSCASHKNDKELDIQAVKASVLGFIDRAVASGGVQEVAKRYARNLLNGRWLWRNRTTAMNIHISVTENSRMIGGKRATDRDVVSAFDAFSVPMDNFDNYTPEELTLAESIAQSLSDQQDVVLNVEARLDFGVKGALEVYPSENYLGDKPKGYGRSLYAIGRAEKESPMDIRIMGQAAIRDQKAGNALRTVDTWYADFAELGRPIPVEPNGANISEQKHFRPIRSGQSAFKIFARLNAVDPKDTDGLFAIASLVRGGVYSESDK